MEECFRNFSEDVFSPNEDVGPAYSPSVNVIAVGKIINM